MLTVSDSKLRIINEADKCQHGELGPLLRREKLYSNQLQDWPREFAEHGVKGLSKSSPGPAPLKTPEQRQFPRVFTDQRYWPKIDLAEQAGEPMTATGDKGDLVLN